MAAVARPDEGGLVVVIGGGITGLAAAHRLIECDSASGLKARVVVLEAAERAGGLIRTERHGDYLLEAGPDAIVTQKPAGLALAERLGLGGELCELGGARSGAQILHRGRLHDVPQGFLMMAPTRIAPVLASSLFTWSGKLRMLCEPFVRRRRADCDDEALASFVRRRFGREVLERVAEPVIASLFTADAERLSLRMTMPRFLDLEAEAGSVTSGLRRAARAKARRSVFGHGTGKGGFVAFRGGTSRIVEAIVERLPDGCVRTGTRVASVAQSPAGGWVVRGQSGEPLWADAVIFACPAEDAARALNAHDEVLAAALSRLRYASCATVNVAYRKSEVGAHLSGFGFFAPRGENAPILACSYVTEKFEGRAPEGFAVFRAFLGGATRPGALDAGDDALIRETHETLSRVLAISSAPAFSQVYRSERAMPQFDVDARETIASIDRRANSHPGLFLAGSVAGAFGLPDCIRSGERSAERAAAFLTSDQRFASLATTVPGSSGWAANQANQNA